MEPNNQETKAVAIHPLNCKWVLYYHLPSDKSWTLSSYVAIDRDIDSAEKVVALNTLLPDHVLYNCMFFCMRDGITPMWEDPQNKNGGCFSYRILNKTVPAVWRKLLALLCGNSLCSNKKHEPFINGITVSPKKNFCIIKIWLSTCKFQDPTIIRDVVDLPREGCLFKNHAPEF
jgi:translation initiation factor 4E